ncbi:O-antigen polymerase [Salinibacterium hongtaonis]|uniref:O-antigen polymerase n=1 Tax=Homoserinimonas hongtaonis TaxID=2079791 RepID=UPI000D3C8FA4|nr:O-antigen polymerase [Salinibacterium hongtaonis]AWB90143.1 hypothetical protein C2138_11840 [Salinibacterium hongtaonis]
MMPNWAWGLCLVLLLTAITFAVNRYNKRAIAVAAFHNVIWGGAIALLGTGLIDYKEASVASWLTLSVGLVAFNVGAVLANFSSRSHRIDTGARADLSEGFSGRTEIVTRPMLAVLTAVYFAAFTIYLVLIEQRFGIATLFTDPVVIRGASDPTYLEGIPLPVRVLLYIGPFLIAIFGYKEAVRNPLPIWLRLSAVALIAVSMFALLQRTNLFVGLLLLAAVLVTKPHKKASGLAEPAAGVQARENLNSAKRKGKLRLGAGVALIGVVGFVAFQAIGGALGKEGGQALSTGAVSSTLERSGLTEPFIYYTGGVAAFLQLVDSTNYEWPPDEFEGAILVGDYNPQTWGARTFSPILKVIPGIQRWNEINPFIDTAVWTNVFTSLEPFYRDFRALGVAFGSTAVGFVIAWAYMRRFKSPRAFWLQAVLVSTLPFATFAFKLNDTLTLVCLFLVLVLTLTLSPRVRGYLQRTRVDDRTEPNEAN